MFKTLNIGKSGLKSFQNKMNIISNNMANVQTTGYKKGNVSFEDLIYDELDVYGTPLSEELSKDGAEMGIGVRNRKMSRIFNQGSLKETGSKYDFAIEGEGFFGVENEKTGEMFLTRDGSFSLDKEGRLVDGNGNIVMIEDNENSGLYYGEDNYSEDSEKQTINIDNIKLFNVVNKDDLINEEGNYFSVRNTDDLIENSSYDEQSYNSYSYDIAYDNSYSDTKFGKVRQGFLEMSNVDLGEEITDMLVTQRAYQINTKSIQSADDMWSMINNIRR